jgi:hypothetical protein
MPYFDFLDSLGKKGWDCVENDNWERYGGGLMKR